MSWKVRSSCRRRLRPCGSSGIVVRMILPTPCTVISTGGMAVGGDIVDLAQLDVMRGLLSLDVWQQRRDLRESDQGRKDEGSVTSKVDHRAPASHVEESVAEQVDADVAISDEGDGTSVGPLLGESPTSDVGRSAPVMRAAPGEAQVRPCSFLDLSSGSRLYPR
eukprot:227828-Hanusia_phi.AAC.2